MKKAIFLFLICSSAYAADFYTFGSLSYDYTKTGVFYEEDKDYFQTQLGSGIEQNVFGFSFFAEAEIKTEMFLSRIGYENGPSFMPTLNSYYVRAGFYRGPVKIGYEHLCNHNSDDIDYRRRGGHNRVFIAFDSRGM